jgi:bacterioferritin
MGKTDKKEKERNRLAELNRSGSEKEGRNGNSEGGAKVTRKELIAGLNEDLSWEFNAIISYRLFASLCTGPYRQELRQFFEAEIPDELGHAMFLADKIVALGGTPITAPAPVEISTDNRRMLEIALQAERDTVRRYKARAEQADALGEVALKVRLEDVIVDETHHAEEIDRILTNWKS